MTMTKKEKLAMLQGQLKDLKGLVGAIAPGYVPAPVDETPRWLDGTPKNAVLDAKGFPLDIERAAEDTRYYNENRDRVQEHRQRMIDDQAQREEQTRNDNLARLRSHEKDVATAKANVTQAEKDAAQARIDLEVEKVAAQRAGVDAGLAAVADSKP